MKAKRQFFPRPYEGAPALRASITWIPGLRSGEYRTARLTLTFSTVKDWDGDYGSMSYSDPRDDFAITAYVSADRECSGWTCGYLDAHYIQAADAERMTGTFRRIERALQKNYERSGQRPQSFGAYVLQVARAIGIERIAFENDAEREARQGSRWNVRAVSDAAYAVDGWAHEVRAAERKAHRLDKQKDEFAQEPALTCGVCGADIALDPFHACPSQGSAS